MSTGAAAVLAGVLGLAIGAFLNVVIRRFTGGGPTPGRDPLVAALTAVLCVAVVLDTEADEEVWLGLAFVLLLVPVTFIDLDRRIIPNKLTALGAVVAIALVVLFQTGDLVEHLIAAAAAGGFLLVAAIAYPAGMGMGDVKLAAVMGLFLGRDVAPAMLAALVLGSVAGIVVIRRHGRKAGVPFGPFLAAGGLVGLFAGDALVDWYLDSFA